MSSFSAGQLAAINKITAWLNTPTDPFFLFAGYAGTGKSTLAMHIAAGVSGRVVFLAPTGKAAYVLQSKGCHGAETIHKAIYTPKEKSQKRLADLTIKLKTERLRTPRDDAAIAELELGVEREMENLRRPLFQLNTESPIRGASLIIVDEASMVDQQVGSDLASFGVPILAMFDPGQLPPVGGAGFFTSGRKPDVMLEEIHRQAADNPIIALSKRVREGKFLALGNYGESKVIALSDVVKEDALGCNQLLVGRNASRKTYNARMRQLLLGQNGGYPVKGDRLVCLRNDHEAGLLNGSIWAAQSTSYDEEEDLVTMTLRGEDGSLVATEAHGALFRGEEIPWQVRKDAAEFDYGYALTVHKAQGSQWDDVFILDESACFQADRAKWLYTAITRAANRVVVVRA